MEYSARRPHLRSGQEQVHSGHGWPAQGAAVPARHGGRHESLALMSALETELLGRHLAGDDRAQAAAAERLIWGCVSQRQILVVPVTVTVELEWVLRSAFGYNKGLTLDALPRLSSMPELSFKSERALEAALHRYRVGTADFADCLHTALAAQVGQLPLWTFDQRAAKNQTGARDLGHGCEPTGRRRRSTPLMPQLQHLCIMKVHGHALLHGLLVKPAAWSNVRQAY